MIRLTSVDGQPLPEPKVTIEEVTDPVECERARIAFAAFNRNIEWLQTQWPRLIPAALGKYVAVADQEAFLTETLQEALAWVREYHPDDKGSHVQFVSPFQGPRIYAHRG
jgi:hypothetical protein